MYTHAYDPKCTQEITCSLSLHWLDRIWSRALLLLLAGLSPRSVASALRSSRTEVRCMQRVASGTSSVRTNSSSVQLAPSTDFFSTAHGTPL